MVSLHKIEAVCRFQFNPLLIPWYQITHPSTPPLPSNPLPLLTPATQFRQIWVYRFIWETPDSGVSARYWLPNKALKQHKALNCNARTHPWVRHVGMCGPKGYGFCAFFGLKRGIHFAHVGPESGMVFKRTLGAYERSYRFNSKWIRQK